MISKAFWYFSQFGKSIIVVSTQETQGARGGKHGGVLFVICIFQIFYFPLITHNSLTHIGTKCQLLDENSNEIFNVASRLYKSCRWGWCSPQRHLFNSSQIPLWDLSPISMETFALVNIFSYIKNSTITISFSELVTASQCSVASS